MSITWPIVGTISVNPIRTAAFLLCILSSLVMSLDCANDTYRIPPPRPDSGKSKVLCSIDEDLQDSGCDDEDLKNAGKRISHGFVIILPVVTRL